MAANRFATMLHRSTNKVTLILTYALLEWILIALLMLNSLFSHLIVKFAEFFGLRPPCPWCARVGHLSDPAKGEGGILCEAHSKGISELGFCENGEKRNLITGSRGNGEAVSELSCDDSGNVLGNRTISEEVNELKEMGREGKLDFDSVTEEHKIEVQVEVKEEVVVVESRSKIENAFHDFDLNEEPKCELPDSMKIEEDGSSRIFQAKGSHLETCVFEHLGDFPVAQWPSEEAGEEMEKHLDILKACEEASQGNNENEADVSIGTEIPDLDIADEIQIPDSNHSYEPIREDQSTNSAILSAVNDHGPIQVEEQSAQGQSLSVHDEDNIPNNEPSVLMELKETEEDKVPETPTSRESLNLDKNLLLFDKRYYVTEESLDGSVTSELEGGDGVVTIERLKKALRSERKNLQALYTELEEERSASAVSTNQTMTMINRLQEEKAAMQMEALQYQRMMEEQSEYDQEALQLLNGLMVKREKEKQELERELEVYRKKHFDYDIKEKSRVLSKSRDGSSRSRFSSASCSNADDSDGLSVDLNQEVKEEDFVYGNSDCTSQNMHVDAVVNLEESLADFEEERLSILEQLKVLEEKLLMLDDESEQSLEDVKKMDENGDHFYAESNFYSNAKHNYKRIAGHKGKSLLPLFDANSDENDDLMMVNGNMLETDGNMKVAIEEEVDHLYGRLQALEADREFLKHCISSLKKGDKGMHLLQEILQHLRDLRSVELCVRNIGEGAML